MTEGRYGTIDMFRMAAAIMIVAIHTGPFSSWNNDIDYIITYCAFRVAVPFFFMVTGYFVIGPYVKSRYTENANVKKYYKKNILLYFIASILYFPINLYSGNLPQSIGQALKMLLFDGTFYHLWYFPAAMMGGLFVLALRKIALKFAVVFSAAAYIIGVLGDSWYGIADRIAFVHGCYNGIFYVTGWTRNGIFFAPLFLLLGSIMAERNVPKKWCQWGLPQFSCF